MTKIKISGQFGLHTEGKNGTKKGSAYFKGTFFLVSVFSYSFSACDWLRAGIATLKWLNGTERRTEKDYFFTVGLTWTTILLARKKVLFSRSDKGAIPIQLFGLSTSTSNETAVCLSFFSPDSKDSKLDLKAEKSETYFQHPESGFAKLVLKSCTN